MTGLKSFLRSRGGAGAIALLVCLAATLGCYHRLLIVGPDGDFAYRAVRWGLKDFMYPRLIYNSDAIRQGIFPLWNPYPFGGCPWASNFQSGLFHPFHLAIILLFGYSAAALQVELVFVFFSAAVGMYLCARGLKASRPGALLSAISFTGCGFFVGNASYLPQILTLSHFPLVFLAAAKVAERPNGRRILWGGGAIALMLFAGYPSMSFFMLAGSFAFGFSRIAFGGTGRGKERARGAAGLIGLLAAGVALAGILLLPALQSYPHVTRPDRSDESRLSLPRDVVLKKSLPPAQTLSLLFPFLGSTDLSSYRLWPEFRNCSIGLVGLGFGAFYLIRSRGRTKAILALLLALSLALSWGFHTPLYSLVSARLPVLRLVSHPAMDFRAIFLFLLCLSAGLGLDRFRRGAEGPKAAAWTLAAAGALWAAGMASAGGRLVSCALGGGEWWASVLALAGLEALKRRLRTLAAPALIVLAIVDGSVWANHNFATVAARAGKGEWKRLRDKERARNRSVITAAPGARAAEYPRPMRSGSMFWKYFSDSGTDSTRLKDFQRLMGTPVRSLLHRDIRLAPVRSVRILNRAEEVWAELREEAEPLRIARIAREDLPSPDLLEKLEALPGTGDEAASGKGRVESFSPDRIVYAVSLRRPGVVLFNEIFYPGWSLRTESQAAPLFRINGAFRGTYLEAGEHRLTMRFRPASFRWGALLSAIPLVIALAGWGKRLLYRRRESAATGRDQTAIPPDE